MAAQAAAAQAATSQGNRMREVELETAHSAHSAALERVKAAHDAAMAERERELMTYETRLQAAADDLSKRETQFESIHGSMRSLREQLDQLQARAERAEVDARSKAAELAEEREARAKDAMRLETAIDEKVTTLERQLTEARRLHERSVVAAKRAETLDDQVARLEAQLAEARRLHERVEAELEGERSGRADGMHRAAAQERELERLRTGAEEQNALRQRWEAERADLVADVAQLRAAAESARRDAETAAQENGTYEARLEMALKAKEQLTAACERAKADELQARAQLAELHVRAEQAFTHQASHEKLLAEEQARSQSAMQQVLLLEARLTEHAMRSGRAEAAADAVTTANVRLQGQIQAQTVELEDYAARLQSEKGRQRLSIGDEYTKQQRLRHSDGGSLRLSLSRQSLNTPTDGAGDDTVLIKPPSVGPPPSFFNWHYRSPDNDASPQTPHSSNSRSRLGAPGEGRSPVAHSRSPLYRMHSPERMSTSRPTPSPK